MRRHRQIGAVVLLVMAAVSCSTWPTGSAEQKALNDPATALMAANAATVARGIAMAMKDPEIRRMVHQQMRSSPLMDHKLTLQRFVETSIGAALVRAMAMRTRGNESAIRSAIAILPLLDFYMPFLENRLSWRASEGVLVGSSFDKRSPELEAYDGNGQVHVLRLDAGAPSTPLVILHPAEPHHRIPAAKLVGQIVQAYSGDAPLQPFPYGSSIVEPCLLDGGALASCGGGGNVSAPRGIYMTHFHGFDNDGWFGSLEMEFRSFGFEGIPEYLYGYSTWFIPKTCSKGTVALTWEPHTNWNGLVMLSPNITNTTSVNCGSSGYPRGYFIHMFEMDGGLNGANDDWGIRFYYPGTPAFGAVVGVNQAFWTGDGNQFNGANQYKANLLVEYR